MWKIAQKCLFAFLLPLTLVAQSPTDERKAVENDLSTGYQTIGAELQHMNILDRMTFYHVHGASVAAIRNGKLAWAESYGVGRGDGPPTNNQTLFHAASISKAVTAPAVMRLVQEKKIDLDHDVNSYLKRWKIPANKWLSQRAVTTRMLLNHTAGFGTSIGQVYKPSTAPTLLQQLNGQAPATNPPVELQMLPGSKFEYSNNGYMVLQLLIEDVTGKPFALAMRQLVLDPLEMTQSTFEMPLPKERAENAASAFGTKQRIGMPADEYVIPNLAAGGLWSTPTDLAKVAIEIQQAYAGKHAKILAQKSARMMLTPGEGFPVQAQGTIYRGNEHWGLGLEMAGEPSHPFFDHSGGGVYNSIMFMYLNGDGMVVMANYVLSFELIHELLYSAGNVYHWPDFAIEEHTRYPLNVDETNALAGDYEGGIHIRPFENGLLYQSDDDHRSAPLIPWSATRLILSGYASELDFELDPTTHRAVSIHIRNRQYSFAVKRVKPDAPPVH